MQEVKPQGIFCHPITPGITVLRKGIMIVTGNSYNETLFLPFESIWKFMWFPDGVHFHVTYKRTTDKSSPPEDLQPIVARTDNPKVMEEITHAMRAYYDRWMN